MNFFKNSLKCKVNEEEVLKNCLEKEYKKYQELYQNPDIQQYFHYIIASIMLAQHERYEDFNIEIPYRFKSEKSMKDKLNDYALNSSVNFNEETKQHTFNIKKILDAFAMKVIACSRPPTFHSNDEEITELINEKKRNHAFLGEMQKFKAQLIKDEFHSPIIYNYDCTKIEYFEKCKQILEQIKTLISPEATNLIKNYDSQIAEINDCINFLKANHEQDKKIEIEDLINPNMNYFKLLNDFTSRIHDKLDLAVLTKQFSSLFINNPVFDELGISLSNQGMKKKRTKDGFVSNFIYIDTLFGTIECQLQSQHEYQEGNYGYAAHTNLKGKSIKPLSIPSEDDKTKIDEFINKIKEIAPKSFLSRIDSTELNRVVTQQFSDYQNYKNLVSQVTRGDSSEIYILNYFARLYAIKDKIFRSQEKSFGFVDFDINQYLQSDSFQKLKESALKSEPQK